MKYFLLFTMFAVTAILVSGQPYNYRVHRISLPDEIKYYDNQFSALQIANGALYLMSESRLQDGKEALLYSILLTDLEQYKRDSFFVLPYKKIHIRGLAVLREKMKEDGQVYEGLEAMYINNRSVYFSVETNTPSPFCYLIKGMFTEEGDVQLSPALLAVAKPRKRDGSAVYNAGFEAITVIENRLFAFYEYNYFEGKNHVYGFDTSLSAVTEDSFSIEKLPFRITDITSRGNQHFTAINYFYKGEGGDTVYRLPSTDTAGNRLIKRENKYYNYCRLIDIHFDGSVFHWQPLWQFPYEYMSYNWEGIAADENGYYIINDKYTPARPYESVLLYLEQVR